VILVVRGIAELRDPDPDPSSPRHPWLKVDEFRWSLGNSLHWAILLLAQLPLQLYDAVLAPSVAVTQQDRKHDDDESASPNSGARSALVATQRPPGLSDSNI
jgi:hypothetical protein